MIKHTVLLVSIMPHFDNLHMAGWIVYIQKSLQTLLNIHYSSCHVKVTVGEGYCCCFTAVPCWWRLLLLLYCCPLYLVLYFVWRALSADQTSSNKIKHQTQRTALKQLIKLHRAHMIHVSYEPCVTCWVALLLSSVSGVYSAKTELFCFIYFCNVDSHITKTAL